MIKKHPIYIKKDLKEETQTQLKQYRPSVLRQIGQKIQDSVRDFFSKLVGRKQEERGSSIQIHVGNGNEVLAVPASESKLQSVEMQQPVREYAVRPVEEEPRKGRKIMSFSQHLAQSNPFPPKKKELEETYQSRTRPKQSKYEKINKKLKLNVKDDVVRMQIKRRQTSSLLKDIIGQNEVIDFGQVNLRSSPSEDIQESSFSSLSDDFRESAILKMCKENEQSSFIEDYILSDQKLLHKSSTLPQSVKNIRLNVLNSLKKKQATVQTDDVIQKDAQEQQFIGKPTESLLVSQPVVPEVKNTTVSNNQQTPLENAKTLFQQAPKETGNFMGLFSQPISQSTLLQENSVAKVDKPVFETQQPQQAIVGNLFSQDQKQVPAPEVKKQEPTGLGLGLLSANNIQQDQKQPTASLGLFNNNQTSNNAGGQGFSFFNKKDEAPTQLKSSVGLFGNLNVPQSTQTSNPPVQEQMKEQAPPTLALFQNKGDSQIIQTKPQEVAKEPAPSLFGGLFNNNQGTASQIVANKQEPVKEQQSQPPVPTLFGNLGNLGAPQVGITTIQQQQQAKAPEIQATQGTSQASQLPIQPTDVQTMQPPTENKPSASLFGNLPIPQTGNKLFADIFNKDQTHKPTQPSLFGTLFNQQQDVKPQQDQQQQENKPVETQPPQAPSLLTQASQQQATPQNALPNQVPPSQPQTAAATDKKDDSKQTAPINPLNQKKDEPTDLFSNPPKIQSTSVSGTGGLFGFLNQSGQTTTQGSTFDFFKQNEKKPEAAKEEQKPAGLFGAPGQFDFFKKLNETKADAPSEQSGTGLFGNILKQPSPGKQRKEAVVDIDVQQHTQQQPQQQQPQQQQQQTLQQPQQQQQQQPPQLPSQQQQQQPQQQQQQPQQQPQPQTQQQLPQQQHQQQQQPQQQQQQQQQQPQQPAPVLAAAPMVSMFGNLGQPQTQPQAQPQAQTQAQPQTQPQQFSTPQKSQIDNPFLKSSPEIGQKQINMLFQSQNFPPLQPAPMQVVQPSGLFTTTQSSSMFQPVQQQQPFQQINPNPLFGHPQQQLPMNSGMSVQSSSYMFPQSTSLYSESMEFDSHHQHQQPMLQQPHHVTPFQFGGMNQQQPMMPFQPQSQLLAPGSADLFKSVAPPQQSSTQTHPQSQASLFGPMDPNPKQQSLDSSFGSIGNKRKQKQRI